MLWHHEFKMLRERLVAIYLQSTFDVEEVNGITERLQELVGKMKNSVTLDLEAAMRKCYDDGVAIPEVMRRCNVDRNTVLNQFYKFHIADLNRIPDFGDPAPSRSALASHKPWVPRYDDKPTIAVSKHSANKAEVYYEKPVAKKTRVSHRTDGIPRLSKKRVYFGPMPTDDEIQRAVEAACKITGGDSVRVFHNYNDKDLSFFFRERDSRARQLALLALVELNPQTSRTDVARKLGVPGNSAQVFYQNIKNGLKRGTRQWIQPGMVEQVIAAVAQSEQPEIHTCQAPSLTFTG